jgi:AraC-like DNA-binding protein
MSQFPVLHLPKALSSLSVTGFSFRSATSLVHRRGHCQEIENKAFKSAAVPEFSGIPVRRGKAFNLVADPWFRFLSAIVIATKDGQQLWANPSRMAYPASRLASFASYILTLFRQNELVAGNHQRRGDAEKPKTMTQKVALINRSPKMAVRQPDRFKAARAFWIGLGKINLTPAAVLRQARLPATLYDGEKNLVTTAQFFALWRAVAELSPDPAAGLKIATQIEVGNRPPSTIAAYHARDYRDALTRLARFKQLCSPEQLQIRTSKDDCFIEPVWQHAQEETPPLLTDAAFASFVELGRNGTGHMVEAKRLELRRSAEATGVHETYFQCPVKFRARRNMLVLHAADLDRPFLNYNAELLEMLDPQLLNALEERRTQRSISEQVKWILKRLLTGARPDIEAVARELGLSDRTLQRRIVDDGSTFRQLLLEARQELAREYLMRPEMDVAEVAYLLGYEDTNSFYRAFRTWEGTTPAQLRSVIGRSAN